MLVNVPALLITPRVRDSLTGVKRQVADEFIQEFVERFDKLIDQLRDEWDDAQIYRVNLRGCLREMEHGHYGGFESNFPRWTEPCVQDRFLANFTICEKPEGIIIIII